MRSHFVLKEPCQHILTIQMIKTDSLNIEFKIDSLSIQEIEEINHSTDEVPLHCIALHNITLTYYAKEQNNGSYTQPKLSIYYICYTALHYIAYEYTYIYTLQSMMPYARLFMMPYVYNMIFFVKKTS